MIAKLILKEPKIKITTALSMQARLLWRYRILSVDGVGKLFLAFRIKIFLKIFV